ncbi:MAG: aldose 1-epimerase [bacterium]
MALLRLASGPAGARSQVVIDPQAGAAIVAYRSDYRGGLMQWLQPADKVHPACFAMVPFCSRIANGRFSFAGKEITLAASLPGEEVPIHGHGLHQNWQVEALTGDAAVLSYDHEPGDWPWAYRCEQAVSLHTDQLRISLTLFNLSASPMPYGMGLHPYFPKHQGIHVTADVVSHLRLDKAGLPVGLEPVPPALQLQDGLHLTNQVLDNVFYRWRHVTRIQWPGLPHSLRLEASANCHHLVIWAPPGESFCCVEPVSNLPDGFNQAKTLPDAFATLLPDEHCTMTFTFTPDPHQRLRLKRA